MAYDPTHGYTVQEATNLRVYDSYKCEILTLDEATVQTTADETKIHQANEAAKSKKYYEDMLAAQQTQLDAFKAADDRRAREALKVKYQGTSAVGKRATGVKIKESQAYGSGSASRIGTAALGRSGKGSELKTLNV